MTDTVTITPHDQSMDGAASLGQAVQARRQELRLSRERLGATVHLSVSTIKSIERGVPLRRNGMTVTKLEAALKWRPGAMRLIAAGLLNPSDAIAQEPEESGSAGQPLAETSDPSLCTPALAKAVEGRRVELGLTRTELASRALVTPATIARVETANTGQLRFNTGTQRGLEHALGWRPGTFPLVAAGYITGKHAVADTAMPTLNSTDESSEGCSMCGGNYYRAIADAYRAGRQDALMEAL